MNQQYDSNIRVPDSKSKNKNKATKRIKHANICQSCQCQVLSVLHIRTSTFILIYRRFSTVIEGISMHLIISHVVSEHSEHFGTSDIV